MKLRYLPVISLFAFGCQSHDFGIIDDDAPTGDEADNEVETGLPPVLRSVEASETTITEGDAVEFVVKVTDVDGQDDLQGGALLSENGALYGAFERDDDTNLWRVAVSWDHIHSVSAIEFEDEEIRTFYVEFRDKSNQTARDDLDLTLSCDGRPACDGSCGLAGTPDGMCAEAGWQDCVEVAPSQAFNCHSVCAETGLTCGVSTDEMGSIWGLSNSQATCDMGYFSQTESSLSMCDAESVGDPELYTYLSCYCD
jgi:hypothetical protein